MKAVTISSGHGKYIRGAKGILDEVDEARKVVNRVAEYIRNTDVKVNVIHDDVSTTQAQNITNGRSSYIVSRHNSTVRDLDVSVHFNASKKTTLPVGTEVFAVSDITLASKVSKAISTASRLKDRGGKSTKNLSFLNSTDKHAILIEVCFVDSEADAKLYRDNFDKICKAIAEALIGKAISSDTNNNNNNNNEGSVRMYKPSNQAMIDSTAIVLSRLEKKENGIGSVHREKLLKGELPLDDALALIYVALERGLIQGQGTTKK